MRINAFTKDEMISKKHNTKLFVEFLNPRSKTKDPKVEEDVLYVCLSIVNDEEFKIVWKDKDNQVVYTMPNNDTTFKFSDITKNSLFVVGPHKPKPIAYIVINPSQAEKDILFGHHLPPKYTDMQEFSTVKDIPGITEEQAKKAICILSNGNEYKDVTIPNEDKTLQHNMIVAVPFTPDDPTDRRTFKYRIRIRGSQGMKYMRKDNDSDK